MQRFPEDSSPTPGNIIPILPSSSAFNTARFLKPIPAGGAGYLTVLPPGIYRSVRPPSSSLTVQPTVMSASYPAAQNLFFRLAAGYRCPISHVQHRNRESVGMQHGTSGLQRRVPVTCTITSMSMEGRRDPCDMSMTTTERTNCVCGYQPGRALKDNV
jgi:hypothetical protein